MRQKKDLSDFYTIPVPLPNARPTCIGKNDSTNISQDLGLEEEHNELKKKKKKLVCT